MLADTTDIPGVVVPPPATLAPIPQEPADIVADLPVVGSRDVAGLEDGAIRLDLSAALTDRDGSEVLTVLILGVPDGASLSHGTRQADGTWSVPAPDLAHLSLTPPQNFSGTLDLTLRATAQESSTGGSSTVETAFRVQVEAVADAPTVMVADAHGDEDTPVSLAGLGGALRDGDGSESLRFELSGVPADASLSAGIRQADGTWRLTQAELSGLKLTPPAHFSGNLSLKLTAIATEAGDNQPTASTSADFTVEVHPVNDAPELTLTAAEQAKSGAHQVEAIGTAHAEDIDSTQLGGAVIALSGAQPGDRLDLEGFILHSENGRTMIGDTGIELVGGAYADESGTLTLSGHASPETYATVLQSLVLESDDQSGLAAGTRSIGVVLFDSEGAASTQKSVDVVIDEVEPASSAGQEFAAASSETTHNGAGSDVILMMADDETETSHGATGSWTEQIDGNHSSDSSHSVASMDEPDASHVQHMDDLQTDASRMNWA